MFFNVDDLLTQGKQKDLDDNRTDSFIHLLEILPKMKHPPKYIFVENVKGFEKSDAHERLKSVLLQLNYSIKEFLLTPKQFGIPNSRLRYYLLARCLSYVEDFYPNDLTSSDNIISEQSPFPSVIPRPLSDFLEDHFKEDDVKQFLLKDEILSKHSEVLDIVTSKSFSSCCFTKGYAHYVQGTGSVLQVDDSQNLDLIYQAARSAESIDKRVEILKKLKLRWFSPREIANVMGFPSTFDFPPSISIKQKYRLLGNSVNVCVVSHLLKYLLLNETI